ncbi:DUF6441 family protein [Sphingomonas sp. Leaf343]|uniref:DUF6441 family protein n=1 Tax=Sphingomonas sp. Leaf343 TaxID=1736345 RepID=UPI0012E14117|nr:DUF6441 family protein [Sphingomonas sp. Leaf343]
MRELEGDLASAATGAMREAMPHARQELREQITGAGLGTRLANTWRGEVYPGSRKSINPSGYIWSNAPDIVDAFDRGAQITPRGGKRFLAIPTDNVPRSPGRGRRTSTKRMTPAEVEQSFSQDLFYRRGKAGRVLAFINAVASSGRSGYGQVMATNVDGLNGQYCLAIKSRRVTISGSYAAGGSNLWIIKSDGSAVGTGTAGKIFVSGLVGEGVGGTTHGLRLFSANAAATSINVTGFDIESIDTAVEIEAATRMSDVTIAQGTARDVRRFGMKASGAIDEISLSAINLIDVATYAAQFLSGRITTRDIYVSMKSGSTAHADDFFRVEPGVVGFSCDNLKMEENRGAGNTVPTLYLQSPRGYNRLSNIDCRIDGNLPLKGFRGQLAVGNSVAISPLIDLDSMHSLVKLDANAAVTVIAIISVAPGGATLPEGYTVTVIPNSGFPYTFANSAAGGNLNIETGDVARTVNQPIRFEWGGAVWHRV